ncbi:MAG: carbohydrate-binding protein [Spirochaetaceae bacterium]|nr:MAG: carbohydrate-binding protein [Spirochaetaceae bacterium]
MNPALPLEHFVPDAEARVWSDGRLYVYGSYDRSGDTFYCSRDYRVFSTSDLVDWRDEGQSFSTYRTSWGSPWDSATLFAPDCHYHDGAYRLYFCTSGNGEGVAVADSPAGPFVDPVPVEGAHDDAIDPAVLVDDDGVYYYWGQFDARGARLLPGRPAIDASTKVDSLINERDHGFHEGACVRKRNGIYYLVYADISRGRPTCLGYATSNRPLGPYTKRGIVIDNTGCDPESWNNHGSIAEFEGRWYVFYHRSSQASRYNRRLCIEPISFNADGTIDEVEMTTGGAQGTIDAYRTIDASRACVLEGSVHAMPVDPAIEGRAAEVLSTIEHGDAAVYRYLDFAGGATSFTARAGSATYGGRIEIRRDASDGPLVGMCEVAPTGGWTAFSDFSCRVSGLDGTCAVWLRFTAPTGHSRQGRLFDLRSVTFRPA